jgi:hypothetical protein
MSRGAGPVQARMLAVLARQQEPLSTHDLAVMVYDVQPDHDGRRWLSYAQLSSVERALTMLSKDGAVLGRRGGHDSRQRWATPTRWADYDRRLA